MKTIYPNPDGRYPSLLVEDGQTLVIGSKELREAGGAVLAMQPQTTAALLVAAGQPPANAPRLSDRSSFEHIQHTEGLVSLSKLDEDRKVDGYSVSFVQGVLAALDPTARLPAASVKRLIPVDSGDRHCGCSPIKPAMRGATPSGNIQRSRDPELDASTVSAAGLQAASTPAAFSVRETRVPEFLFKLNVFSIFTRFADIVVGRNATLILDEDISFAIADNVLAYRGSRIVQRAGYMNLDVTGLMRGSLINIIHRVTDVVAVDYRALAAEPATKP
jgi:hypothetical protein